MYCQVQTEMGESILDSQDLRIPSKKRDLETLLNAVENCMNQFVLTVEVPVYRPYPNIRPLGDHLDRGAMKAMFGDQLKGCLKNFPFNIFSLSRCHNEHLLQA